MQFEMIRTFWHMKTWYSFSYLIFGTKSLKIYIKKYLKQFSTQTFNIVQNVLIPSSPKIPQGNYKFEWPDGSYSASNVQDYAIEKHETVNGNLPTRIYVK